MSDCSTEWKLPKAQDREPGVLYCPHADVSGVRAIDVRGERFERVRECENASPYAGEFKCSECGAEWKTEDMNLVEPTLWIDGVADYPSYCQHCGARVKEGGDE